ncbi:hypothetical protein K503DRAFT_765967 [Rhizopogon vinicolor AM-OR11-026]|uniref:RanBD1 domain-containing protein n=1 Tax=Rhizopogon vinicolor AM-OR11-026 TaxID=1314800 RepID=A0A1B7NEH7_9AGAM|nr:hypothetical protein K503DRAFT_765967 [Rhizopogon vinicolor AM-OR11-026]
MSHSVDDIDVVTNNDPKPSSPFADQESEPEPSADDFEAVPEDKEDAVESIQQGDAAGEIEISLSSVSSSQDAEPDASEVQDAAHGLLQSRHASDSESGDSDKGLKRKLADRATSQGPENLVPLTSAESAKRPRDDTNKDDNPREPKRPSPPPEQNPAPAETSMPRFGGFMAYAATASPFAAVKGQNIFSGASSSSSKKPSVSPSPSPSPPLTNNTLTPSSPFAGFVSSQWSTPHMPASTATKRTGFEAFMGSTSPFVTAGASPFPSRPKSPLRNASGKSALGRSKSPPRRTPLSMSSAFSPYASGGVQSFFAAPHPKRARAESPNGGSSRSSLERTSSTGVNVFGSTWNGSGDGSGSGEEVEEDDDDEQENERPPSTFGERLRAGRDDEEEEAEEERERERLQEQEVVTGEEDEETIHHVRAKLYALCSQNQWKERGTGLLKLNVRRSDGGGARLLMRKEAVYTVMLNVTLFSGMKCFIAQDPRYIRFSVIEDGATTHYNLRVSNAKIAQDLLEEIKSNIPG